MGVSSDSQFSRERVRRRRGGSVPRRRSRSRASHLAKTGPAPQRTLVDRLQLDKSSMVYVIDELERQNLVYRRRDTQDRRFIDYAAGQA